MFISVNNKSIKLAQSRNIAFVLQDLKLNLARGVAVAVNDEVVPKCEWPNYILQENDRLIIIHATQGG